MRLTNGAKVPARDPESAGVRMEAGALPPRRQLIISLIVACAMFMQNLHCQANAHAITHASA
jgi:hypothetical protein